MAKKTITFVTGNANKLAEVKQILGPRFDHHLVCQKIDLPEYQGSRKEVTEKKCIEAARLINGPVLIEDTSLGFKALGGLPGPYIKWFMEEIGAEGLHKMLQGFEDKSAVAICSFAYSNGPEHPVDVIEGSVQGQIVKPLGASGFGFDPCFLPEGSQLTFGQMEPSEKNASSHRFKAVTALAKYLAEL
eukprot:TRINITY_DN3962_c0_g4_i1.p1 TRINITY_DN3962_c0_g4~~TRINITY_DN3962_c0_g4_i1.p1  ORF type:complete len:188 (+),score=69.48 TRINITY_DN3962_c0_g4_i1:44-607(+)